jgi:hypothetical protein
MVEGRIFLFFTGILVCGAILLHIQKAKSGKKYQLRPMPALDAIDEAIGRAVEMGRAVHYTPGVGNLTTMGAPTMFATLDILAYIAEKSARMDVDFVATTGAGDVQTISEEIVRHAYSKAGRPDAYSIDKVRYLSTDQWAYASEIADIIRKEDVQANLMIGYFAAEALVIAESAHQAGAIQVAGTTNTYQMPFFVASCDYVLIGEEVLAASAYFSDDPVVVGSLVGEDFGKAFCLALILAGAILNTLSVTFLNELIKK